MPTKDVAVYDGENWVSISGADGAPGADGKDVLLHNSPPSQAINVPNATDEQGNPIPGTATLSLVLNGPASDDSTNVYDMTLGVPVGVPGPQGEPGTGVTILGSLQNPVGTPVVGPPTQGNTQPDHDICTDGPGSSWLDSNGDLWVWDSQDGSCSAGNPPNYNNVGSIQGPAGDAGNAPTFTSDVPVTYKECQDYTTSATIAEDGGTTADPNYKISMQIPRPVKVYQVAGTDSPNGVSDACVGDFWIVTD